MRIVHVETGRRFYGGAQQVTWLMQGLAVRGVDSLLVCPPDAAIVGRAKEIGIAVSEIPCGGDYDLRFAWHLHNLLKREAPDILHCHSRRGADFLGGLAANLAGVPAILSRRVDNPESSMTARMRYAPFRKVIAISENIAGLLVRTGMDPAKLETIIDAVDVDCMNAEPDRERLYTEFGIDPGAFAIAVVAQLIPRKGHRFMLDVLPGLVEAHPGIRAVFFGAGDSESQLRALTSKLALSSTVTFAGFRDDLDDYLGAFDLLVHPAEKEGLGVAMLKGAAAGLPVVAFDVAGAKECVVHGRTGVLVKPGDVESLQKAIDLMIEEPRMRRDFGAAGRQRMRDEFSVESMVERHIDVYEQVIHG